MRRSSLPLATLVLLCAGPSAAFAQMSPAAHPGPAEGSIATPAQAVDSQISILESEMMPAVRAMPAEKFAFAPSAALFASGHETNFTGVRTFAQQAAHVAQANYFFATMIADLKPDTDIGAIAKLTAKDDIVKALAGSFAFLHRAAATLTPANSFQVIHTPEPGLQTRGTLATFAVSHGFDHYGQMVEYLRMNGIVPPASAK